MEKIQTLIDSFVDFEGVEHKFMLAAVSVNEPDDTFTQVYDEKYGDWDDEILLPKSVRLGVAICNPNDEWNEEMAYKISTGRAKSNSDYALYATHRGMINTDVVSALLKQECAYIKENPGCVIPGYDARKAKAEEKKKREEMLASLDEDEKTALGVLKVADEETIDKILYLVND